MNNKQTNNNVYIKGIEQLENREAKVRPRVRGSIILDVTFRLERLIHGRCHQSKRGYKQRLPQGRAEKVWFVTISAAALSLHIGLARRSSKRHKHESLGLPKSIPKPLQAHTNDLIKR